MCSMIKLTKTFLAFITFSLLSHNLLFAAEVERSADFYRKQCNEIKKYVTKKKYKVSCLVNYHHYNSTGPRKNYSIDKIQDEVKIASFNLWHPGQRKSIFKDYKLMAEMINQWDLISAIELQAVIGPDLEHNNAVVKFIEETPGHILKLSKKLVATTAPKAREKLIAKIEQLSRDLKIAPTLYRAPGYLTLLTELRKLDSSWSLLLSSQGESSLSSNVQELAGFFYRSAKVKPRGNDFCRKYRTRNLGHPFGCTVPFDGKFLGTPYKTYFSRKPFIASFISGNFKFVLATSHFVFNSPRDPQLKLSILKNIFNVERVEDIGDGAHPSNYARLAELKMITQFLTKYKQDFNERNLIFAGDFNLETKNDYVHKILNEDGHGEWDLLVDTKTSLSLRKASRNGTPTNGLASNYDHFIILKDNRNCDNLENGRQASAYNFISDHFMKKKIESKYKIRTEEKNSQGYYIVSPAGKTKGKNLWESFKTMWSARQTIKNNQIVTDMNRQQSTILDFKRRVLDSQLQDSKYYRYFHEVLSDHLPIKMSCLTN